MQPELVVAQPVRPIPRRPATPSSPTALSATAPNPPQPPFRTASHLDTGRGSRSGTGGNRWRNRMRTIVLRLDVSRRPLPPPGSHFSLARAVRPSWSRAHRATRPRARTVRVPVSVPGLDTAAWSTARRGGEQSLAPCGDVPSEPLQRRRHDRKQMPLSSLPSRFHQHLVPVHKQKLILSTSSRARHRTVNPPDGHS